MPLIAHLAADAASFSFHPGDGSAASAVETPWHRAVVLIEDAAGNVIRSVEAFADGRLDVRGEGAEPHEASGKSAKAENADTPDGQAEGFAGFSQHADEAAGEAKS